jgi:hypothetical protein
MTTSETDTAAASSEQPADDVLVETTPTLRPTAIRLALVVVVGLGIVVGLRLNPELLGTRAITGTAALVVGLLTVLLMLRYALRALVLLRTTYTVTPERIERRYELLFRTQVDAVRFDKLRSHELTQSRVQSLLGFGTVSMNRGLGALRLEDIADPHAVYETIESRAEG